MTALEDELKALVGRSVNAHDECALPLVRRLLAFLDRDVDLLANGDPLPSGWQVVLFAPVVPQGQLGADGTPDQTVFLPAPTGFPRRMMGGRRSLFRKPIPIGSKLHRTTTIVDAVLKQGRSGDFVIVKNLHRIFVQGDAAASIEEEYDVIFRQPSAGGGEASAPARPDTPVAARTHSITTSEALIFRYSAATFNAHRIHYDLRYTRDVEKYPAIVVNGGIAALFLLEFAKTIVGNAVSSVDTKLVGSALCGETIELCWAGPQEPTRFWSQANGRPNVLMTVTAGAA